MREVFQGKIAIVTGASSGIGRAAALALARRGAHVVLAARRKDLLEEVAGEVRRLGRQALVIPSDVTDQAQVNAVVAETLSQFSRLDILISNAGAYIRSPVSEITPDKIEQAMRVNFYGGVYAILAVLPHMRSQGSGHIVVVTSVDAKKGLPLDAPYVSAKFALAGFTDVLRQELYGSGVCVSNILPGRVDTEMISSLRVPAISAKISAEAVAETIVRAIARHKAEAVVPMNANLLIYANTFSPRLADWFVRIFHLEGWSGHADDK